jgi:hypothetical protein
MFADGVGELMTFKNNEIPGSVVSGQWSVVSSQWSVE